MAASTYLASQHPRLLAHRGLAVNATENTAAAFTAALAAGADYIETDVRLTRDGVPVLWHDPDISRLTGQSQRISDLDWQDLRQSGTVGQAVTTLEQALVSFPSARFNIDLKVDEVVHPAIALIDALAASDRVLLTSFSDARRRRAQALLPGVATSPGIGAVLRGLLGRNADRARWARTLSRVLAGAVALQIPERFRGIPVLSDGLIQAAHLAGAEVHVWTVNDPVRMKLLLDRGVDGLVTDRVDLAVEVRAAR